MPASIKSGAVKMLVKGNEITREPGILPPKNQPFLRDLIFFKWASGKKHLEKSSLSKRPYFSRSLEN